MSPDMTKKPSTAIGRYPTTRMRRNRHDDWTRRLISENSLSVDDLIWPVFVHDGDGAVPVESMPDQERLLIPLLVEPPTAASDPGLPMIAGLPVL